MNYTTFEHTVIKELEERAGDVLYLKDIAPYFISKSCLQISTYTQTAYIQLGDNMQSALSEYFQLVVFLKKLEENGSCFSIPYTPLQDNLIIIGNRDFQDYQQQTIADSDLLIQLFQYAGKKYVIAPKAGQPEQISKGGLKANFLIPGIILLLLFIFIGAIGYQSYVDSNRIRLKQEAIGNDLEKQTLKIGLLSKQIQNQELRRKENLTKFQKKINEINTLLEGHNSRLSNINYWNRRQSIYIEKLIQVLERDSI
ncbi:hypothetical protein MATR_17210 [Marivirga tractuosa]|uniref:Uncharacterized protein n=1 Tax=Marivirga tractuosa (strain ATCC 23168 / DSM 4126 / NBRC 15989 / NCIMB 1408 / VKM B-1430 / H-43) TaxID=643867 RepID=E4TRC0_MARTH|nr:hypothetical protein [Marivirga tractuosa]ADR20654.1 hypothetical protein Ftrac_0652 [Marivirga tractuosa DSM 4126]BDD14896.1 hypothetical protein MATR_17210 [Marivirga tractuosa]